MSLNRIFFMVATTAMTATLLGCAGNGLSSDDASGLAFLPNLTNVPEEHETPDGFDPPFDFY